MTKEQIEKILNDVKPSTCDRIFKVRVYQAGLEQFHEVMKKAAKNYNYEINKKLV